MADSRPGPGTRSGTSRRFSRISIAAVGASSVPIDPEAISIDLGTPLAHVAAPQVAHGADVGVPWSADRGGALDGPAVPTRP